MVWLECYYQVLGWLVVMGGGKYCSQFVWVVVVVVDYVYFGVGVGGDDVQVVEVMVDVGEVFQCMCDGFWGDIELLVDCGGGQCVEYVVFVWQCQCYWVVVVFWQVQGEVYVWVVLDYVFGVYVGGVVYVIVYYMVWGLCGQGGYFWIVDVQYCQFVEWQVLQEFGKGGLDL